ncbi:hypothetical protein Tco_0842215 [Tanacetum coccineum]|uniref:Uncharacterized protein n=1 Tax=Tanacetum coccineum TaxID=301880 RepID=A0ABQ5B1X9_9ASTR
MSDLAEARKKKKKRHGLPKTPFGSPPHPLPPPPPPAGPSGTSGASGAFGSSQSPPPPPPPSNTQGGQSTSIAAPSSSKTAASAEYTAWTMTDTRIKPSVSPIPKELHMGDDTTADEQAYSSNRPATPEPAWSIPSSDLTVPTNNWASALKSTYTPPPENSLLAQIGDTATFMDWPTLSISKMKAAYYPDVGLEQMVPDQMWVEEECKYDVAAIYADLKEYVIAERDIKYLYPSDFEDLYLLNLQGHLNHLSPEDKKILTTAVNLWTRNLVIRQRVEDFQLGIESYQTQLNLTKPRWDAKGFEYKHDFTVIDSPRAVTFRDKYGVQMIMRFNEIHKFSDGTLHQIDEALDYRVKEFRVNRRNPGLDTRFWTKKDVDRSKEFMFAIQK